MKHRLLLSVLLTVLAAACGGDTGRSDEAEAEGSVADDPAAAAAQAIDELRLGYIEHYNLHHPSMVADYYGDNAVALLADGSVSAGREAITANLEAAMAGNPTVDIETDDLMVFGDAAVSRGSYTVDLAPEGAPPTSMAGHFMSVFENVEGEWKLGALLTNYDAPPPEGSLTPSDDEPPPDLEDNPWAELTAAWATHYNLGHASMVADLYAEDAVTLWGNQPVREGRAAITAALETEMANGSPQIELHDVMVRDLGDGWHVGLGWYTTTLDDDSRQSGAYMVLTETAADGSTLIRWDASHAAW
jgi:ketosteroid isomerase-like protein